MARLQVVMVLLQLTALMSTFLETHALSDMLTRPTGEKGNEKADNPVDEGLQLL